MAFYINRFNFKKDGDVIKVFDKKTEKKGEIPVKYEDLSEGEQKAVKKFCLFSRIFSLVLPGYFLLAYQAYLYFFGRFLIGILLNGLLTNITHIDLGYAPGIFINIIMGSLIIWRGHEWAYDAGSYYLRKAAYLSKEKKD